MFEQLPAWDSKITLRGAMRNAIAFGFVAGIGFGVFLLRLGVLRFPTLYQADVVYFAVALALAIRFYFLAMSRARKAKRPDC